MKQGLTGASSKAQLRLRAGEFVSTQRRLVSKSTRALEKGARRGARRCGWESLRRVQNSSPQFLPLLFFHFWGCVWPQSVESIWQHIALRPEGKPPAPDGTTTTSLAVWPKTELPTAWRWWLFGVTLAPIQWRSCIVWWGFPSKASHSKL